MTTSSIDRLTEIVRRAEAKATAETLREKMQQAKTQLEAAVARSQSAQAALQQIKPACLRELDEAETDERKLRELSQTAAQYKSFLEESSEAEQLISAARQEIEQKRRTARETLERCEHEAGQARDELQVARQRYEEIRRERDRLRPGAASDPDSDDDIVAEAALFFPDGQLRALEREIDDSRDHYGALSRPEQYAQLKVWLGRLRQAQASELPEDAIQQANRIYGQLVGISKQYQPGYIHAFRQEFEADWDVFILEARQELQEAIAARQGRADLEQQQREQERLTEERRRQAREESRTAIEELKAIIARFDLPQEGMDEFRAALRKVTGYGTSDPELLDLVMPYRELIAEGGEFRALRRNLDRLQQEQSAQDESPAEDISDLLELTRGKRVLMIGGARREEVRRQLQQLFQFERLDWEDYDDKKSAKLESLEQRIRHGSLDVMLILKSFISHYVPERFRPLCEQHGIHCLLVEQGYGAAQITRTLRRGLLRQTETV